MNFIGHLDWTVSTSKTPARRLPVRRPRHEIAATLSRWTIAAIAAILVVAPAGADPVYRCAGNVYQSEPCPGGRTLDIDLDRNVVERERRRPTPAAPPEPRRQPEVVVIERAAPQPAPVIVREPVYLWPPRPQPRLHAPPPPAHRRHPQGERPKPRAPQDVGRPAYGFRP